MADEDNGFQSLRCTYLIVFVTEIIATVMFERIGNMDVLNSKFKRLQN